MERIHNYLKELTYTKDEIKKFNLQECSYYPIPTKEDFDMMQTINDVLHFLSQNLQ